MLVHARKAVEKAPLELSGAWRLDDSETKRLGDPPPGGWRRFTALLAGTPYLKTKQEHFITTNTPIQENELSRQLAEAFSKRLIPPKTASGVFITLGIHPAWGVHLAQSLQNRTRKSSEMFPEKALTAVQDVVSQAIRNIIDRTAREMTPEEFKSSVKSAIDDVEYPDTPDSGLSPFVDVDGYSIYEMAIHDILENWLIPCNRAYMLDKEIHISDLSDIEVL